MERERREKGRTTSEMSLKVDACDLKTFKPSSARIVLTLLLTVLILIGECVEFEVKCLKRSPLIDRDVPHDFLSPM